MRIVPRCRFCGVEVANFGDVCAEDTGATVNEVWAADQAALEQRMADAEMGDL